MNQMLLIACILRQTARWHRCIYRWRELCLLTVPHDKSYTAREALFGQAAIYKEDEARARLGRCAVGGLMLCHRRPPWAAWPLSPISYSCFHSSLPILRISLPSTTQYLDGALPCTAVRAATTAARPMYTWSWPRKNRQNLS